MVNFKELIKEDMKVCLNVSDKFKNLSVDKIKKISSNNKLPFSIALLNVTGELNTGSIIRTAHNFGVEKVFIIGRSKLDARSLVGCQNYTNIIKINALNNDLLINETIFKNTMIENNLNPIFIETNGETLDKVDWKSIIDINLNPCFVFGNEGRGISDNILNLKKEFMFSKIISIPMHGVMRSHNVSVASGIIMWEYYKLLIS